MARGPGGVEPPQRHVCGLLGAHCLHRWDGVLVRAGTQLSACPRNTSPESLGSAGALVNTLPDHGPALTGRGLEGGAGRCGQFVYGEVAHP